MKRPEIEKLKVGSRIKTLLGDIQEVVAITNDHGWFECKWINENGELSKGSEFKVPTHFEFDTLVSL